jgi:hypothetical protein
MFSMIGDDGKRYDFAMPPHCFVRLFAIGWKAAQGLGPAPQQGESVPLEAQISSALVNMKPALLLMSGSLALSLSIDQSQLAVLQDGLKKIAAMDKGPKH